MKRKKKTLPLQNRLLFFLSLIGVAIALYVSQSFLRDAPIVCVNSGCELVRHNQASYIAGIPVPVFGLIGYSLIALLSFIETFSSSPLLPKIKFVIAAGGVIFVSWFTYTEVVIIHAICTWCALSALTMVIVALLAFENLRVDNRIRS